MDVTLTTPPSSEFSDAQGSTTVTETVVAKVAGIAASRVDGVQGWAVMPVTWWALCGMFSVKPTTRAESRFGSPRRMFLSQWSSSPDTRFLFSH